MAVLGATTLTGCLYIESFLGGREPTTNVPFRCMFENASVAPISWTKETGYSTNGIALRVVNGTIGSRTSTAFSQILTQRDIGLSIQQNTSAVTANPNPANITIGPVQAGGPSFMGQSLADLPAHTHSYQRHLSEGLTAAAPQVLVRSNEIDTRISGTIGGNTVPLSGHPHQYTFTNHQHTIGSAHSHTIGPGLHSHPTGSTQESFSVSYRDVIIAEKDVKP
jgi:hypothetical protein